MWKYTKKGKNPGPVDSWLENLGYYRKNVAYDETCLFRAIAEQLFSCQLFHEICRKEIVQYGRENVEEFEGLMPKKEFLEHLKKLEVHMAISGTTEMHIISKKYKKDVILFDGVNKMMIPVATNENYCDSFLLCFMGEDHYDVVYKTETIQTAGFCQSIVYTALYENVFNIKSIPKIVEAMLYEKTTLLVVNSECDMQNLRNNERAKHMREIQFAEIPPGVNFDHYEYMLKTNIAPFPFKIAKALDPTIYRNIEYDTWTEVRKELRLGQWYYGDNNLILGTCCILHTETGVLQCYIQEILKEEDKCVVYITSLAEKRIVKYSELSPETDAKPWPLPYRFSRGVASQPPKVEVQNSAENDNGKRTLKKRREKKQSQSKSSNDDAVRTSPPTLTISTDINDNTVKVFQGHPLQMQQNTEEYEAAQQPVDLHRQHRHQQPVTYTSEVYEQSCWNKDLTAQEQVWPQTPTTPNNVYAFVAKQTMPNTPEANYAVPYYYGVPRYVWPTTPDPIQVQQQQQQQTPQHHNPSPITSSPQMDIAMSPDPYYYYGIYQTPAGTPLMPLALTPTTPQVEMYQPVYSETAPVTPIIYTSPASANISEPQEMNANGQEVAPGFFTPIYSPVAVDMSYVPSSYIYPPTPPAAWYRQPPISSQGFIFPTPADAAQK